VLRVIELHVEALFEFIGERLARRIVAVDALVADRTHGNIRRRELRQMTTGTIFVARETRPRRAVVAMMTVCAADRSML
jgi:hypothetical protein